MTGGLVLAAGAGTRFGGDGKLLAPLRGRPLLEWAVTAACAVPELGRVVVVLGARAGRIVAEVEMGRAEPVVCPDWAEGQSASLRCGLAALEGCQPVIVTLGDQPELTPGVIARFVGQPGGTRAVYEGRPGHPVVLGPEQIAAVLGTGPGSGPGVSGDEGARDLLGGGPVIEVGHLCSGRDVDTPEDLEALRHEA